MSSSTPSSAPGHEAAPRLGAAYWRMWWGGAIDDVGDGAFAVAVSLLAASLTHDARLVATVSTAASLPWLLFTLPAGTLADRRDRLTLMWVAQAFEGVAVAVVAVLAALGTVGIPALALLAFAITTGDVVFNMAAQSILPSYVPKPLLVRANSRFYLAQTIGASFIGRPIGSLLFGVAVALPFGVDAGSFAVSVALLLSLRRLPTLDAAPQLAPDPDAAPRRATSAWADTVEGLRWLGGHRLLRTLAVVLGANNFANQLGTAIMVLFATRTLHVTPTRFGWVLGAAAIGALIGGFVNARITARLGAATVLVGSLAVNAVVYLAISVVSDGVELAALMACTGFSVTLWNVVSVSMRQQLVPAQLLGRVNSVYRMLGWGMIPLGTLAGGFVAHYFGLRMPFLAAGVLRLAVLAVAVPVLVPTLRKR